jgi:ureidoglycolate lyase
LGSQAFIPLNTTPLWVVVAPPGDHPEPHQLQAFISNGYQGVNYHPGVWHMPLMTPDAEQRFIIVDRGGAGENCEEYILPQAVVLRV